MSNRICKKCKSTNVVEDGTYGGTTYYRCDTCHHLGEKDDFPEMTVFDRITESPDVLAEKLVYYTNFRKKKPLYDWKRRQIADRWFLCGVWKSSITDETYYTKAEAIAATVTKLKEQAQ